MKVFIDVTKDDFWTALRDDTFIKGCYKPKPYKNYRLLTAQESCIASCRDHILILLTSVSNSTIGKRYLEQSLANFICEDFPQLAEKHNLTINRKHEYWRAK